MDSPSSEHKKLSLDNYQLKSMALHPTSSREYHLIQAKLTQESSPWWQGDHVISITYKEHIMRLFNAKQAIVQDVAEARADNRALYIPAETSLVIQSSIVSYNSRRSFR